MLPSLPPQVAQHVQGGVLHRRPAGMGARGSLEMDANTLWASGVLLVVSDFQLLRTGHSHHLWPLEGHSPSFPLAHGLNCSSRAMLVRCPIPGRSADAFCRSWGDMCSVGATSAGFSAVLGWPRPPARGAAWEHHW